MDKAKEKRQQRGDSTGFSDDDQSRADSDESESSNTSTTRGRGRGRGRGQGRGSTARGRGSTAKGSTAKGQVSRGGTLKNFLSKEKLVTNSFAEGKLNLYPFVFNLYPKDLHHLIHCISELNSGWQSEWLSGFLSQPFTSVDPRSNPTPARNLAFGFFFFLTPPCGFSSL